MPPPRRMGGNFWSLAAGVYLICALCNLLMLAAPMAPPVVTDAAGRQSATSQILAALAAVSLLIMTPLGYLAVWRARTMERVPGTPRGVVHATS